MTGSPTPTATTVTQSTPTVKTAQSTPTVNIIPTVACDAYFNNSPAIGGLAILPLKQLVGYPLLRLPDGIAQQPLNAATIPNFGTSTGSNINLWSYGFSICNKGTTPITISQISLRVVAFTPIGKTLDGYQYCDGYYDSSNGQVHEGACGGGYVTDLESNVTLPATTALNSTVDLQEVSQLGTGSSALPLSLNPNQQIGGHISLTANVNVSATMQFALMVQKADHSVIQSPPSADWVYAQVRYWTGKQCDLPQFKNAIKPNTGKYICPLTTTA